jgi:hypothetical protein
MRRREDPTDDASRLRRLLEDLGHYGPRGLARAQLNALVWSRCGLTADSWPPYRLGELVAGRAPMTANDVRVLAEALRVDPWRLLWNDKPDYSRVMPRTLWDVLPPLGDW